MALFNIIGYCSEFRDMILDTKFLENLPKAVQMEQSSTPIDLVSIGFASRTLANLTSAFGKEYPIWSKISASIPVISTFLNVEDERTLLHVARALSWLVDNPGMVALEMSCLVEQINHVIEKTTNPELTSLLTNVTSKICNK